MNWRTDVDQTIVEDKEKNPPIRAEGAAGHRVPFAKWKAKV